MTSVGAARARGFMDASLLLMISHGTSTPLLVTAGPTGKAPESHRCGSPFSITYVRPRLQDDSLEGVYLRLAGSAGRKFRELRWAIETGLAAADFRRAAGCTFGGRPGGRAQA